MAFALVLNLLSLRVDFVNVQVAIYKNQIIINNVHLCARAALAPTC